MVVYENASEITVEMMNLSDASARTAASKSHSDEDGTTVPGGKLLRCVAVSFCLLCFLQVALNISLRLALSPPPGIDASFKNLTEERDELRSINLPPLGINLLAQMLPKLCKEPGTTAIYTNHSLRATAIQKLSGAGLEAREIMTVSGHRSESSLKSYWKPSMESRKRWSNTLSDQKAESAVPVKPQSTMQSPETYFTGCTINGYVHINVYKEY
ncbi:uncharacterized protein LOC126390068 isoform X3 [Epinephelus moara]|uniref:uncharacterized protein LOC126390068 isoform X3 n=1 Tax=Epinephelus moara TaxID=300413 RepID=UPI00214E2B58|nr:uncharacterized protein LOC126390068 isoform X3 [Epinephelus moara]